MNSQPESEHEAASTSMSVPLLSLPLSTLHPLSPLSSTFLPSPVTSVTEEQPESEPASTSEFSKFGLSPRALSLPPDQTLPSLLPSPTLSSLPLLENSTLGSLPVTLSPDQSFESLLSEALGQSSKPCESESTLVSAAGVVPPRLPELSLCGLLLYETIPLLPAQHEVSVAVPASRHSTPPQRSLGCKIISSVSSALDVTPPFALLIPRLGCRDSPLVYEAPSTRLPTLAPPSLLSLRLSGASIRFNFAFVFITTAVLVSAFLNVSATTFTLARKFWSKYEDLGNNQNGNLKTSNSRNIPAHRLRLGQLTPRAPRLVFDPGGQSSSFKLLSAHEDVRQRKSKTRIGFITTRSATLLTPILANDHIVFDPGGVDVLDVA
ncbi:hypothetical protein EDB85DRAFT_1901955 [Lactarius pseudohatsudake]|nr:hypothetical protein EDB85DRAFT_1901955 [Lactarius pseudohatsudake]